MFFIWFLALASSSYALSPNSTIARIDLFTPKDSLPLSPTLLSFSIEQDGWADWTGVTSRNEFVYNAFTNIAKITGHPPKIRVGAHSEDKTSWNASMDIIDATYPQHSPSSPYPEASKIIVGDAYYKLSKWMPNGTHMTWGLNLGYNDIENAVNMAQSIMRAFNNANQVDDTGVFLDRLELGNEPDLFAGSVRPANWTIDDYVSNWESTMAAIASAIQLSPDGPVTIQACSFGGQTFTPRKAFASGLLDSEPGKLITAVAQHRFSIGGPFQLTSYMAKTAVRSNISIFSDDIAATRANGLEYILGGPGGMSNVAGAALFTIDYVLQAATRGVSELYLHEAIGRTFNFASFEPVALDRSPVDDAPLNPPLPPHAQPDYYSAIIIAEAIGAKAASGQTKIKEIELEGNISGYAIYEHGVLARAIFINLTPWLATDEGVRERTSTHIDFQFPSDQMNSIGTVTVRRLKIGHADDTKNLTWNGQSYETPDILASGTRSEEKTWFRDGFDIAESEAVMILF